MVEVLINGRFAVSRPAATYAVSAHLTEALNDYILSEKSKKITALKMICPKGDLHYKLTVSEETPGRFKGNLWEQTTLARAASRGLLINLASRSPLFSRNSITMFHDAQVITSPASYSWMFRTTSKINMRLAGRLQRGILTVSDFAKSELIKYKIAPQSRIHVIHNGVDHVFKTPEENEILQRFQLERRGYALALSNLQPHKNIGILLKAFSQPILSNETLVLVGRTSREDFIAAGHHVPPNVVFTGYVSSGEMRSLQSSARAVLMPSITEGFGLPPVEGMLLGTPAIIAPAGALPEVCGPKTLTADPYSPDAWIKKYYILRENPQLWYDLSKVGQSFARQFTWSRAAQRLISVLESSVS